MITKLGIVAGEIWHLLDKSEKVDLAKIIEKVDAHRDVILMSIGWLAREGHIVLEGDTPNHVVSLRRQEV